MLINPDAAAVHLDDLLSDGKAKASPALGLGVGVVDLMELLEDTLETTPRRGLQDPCQSQQQKSDHLWQPR